jgi:hypothetical protein
MKTVVKKPIIFILLFFVVFAFCDSKNCEDVEGNWIGGFKLQDKWILVCANFSLEDGVMTVVIDLPLEDITIPAQSIVCLDDSRVKFLLPNGSEILIFDGKCEEVTFSGCVKHAREKGTFHLFRVPEIEPLFANKW